jgi:GT2 family glycosyltransferase
MTLASVIVTHYQKNDLTQHVLQCLADHQSTTPIDLIVVDNGSAIPFAAQALSRFVSVKVARITKNVGLGAACETGIQAIDPKNRELPFIILNNDVSFEHDLVKGLLDSLADHPMAGLIGPRVIFPDGRFQLSWGDDLNLRSEQVEQERQRQMHLGRGSLYRQREKESNSARTVDWISGASFLMTRPAHDAIGGMDGGYLFYFEDCDWSKRVRLAGLDIWYDPRVTVKHALGATLQQKQPEIARSLHFSRSRVLGHLRYYARFCSWSQFQCLRLILALKALMQKDYGLFCELVKRDLATARRLSASWPTAPGS